MEKVTKIWLTDSEIWIQTKDGKTASEKFADYPRLKYATEMQRKNYTADDFGIHWEELDEDLSFEGFFQKKNDGILYRLFMEHPELNASAIARRMGISQSLFAQYISGIKKPSEKINHGRTGYPNFPAAIRYHRYSRSTGSISECCGCLFSSILIHSELPPGGLSASPLRKGRSLPPCRPV